MTYQVMARKWRPRSFATMVGQSAVQKALRSMLQSQKLPHAFLFSGTRGVGKTTLARLLAKCMLCETGITAQPCETCAHCVAVDAGTHLDVIEVDAASRTKVEDTRDLMENMPYAPHSGRFKIYIIDEVHMLSNHSFNALLKTLEEPPTHVKFIFATTEPEKCPVTMLSRCIHFTLKPLTLIELSQHLTNIAQAEGIVCDSAALRLLAEKAKGSVRDALTLLEEARHFSEEGITLQDVQSMLGLLSIDTLLPLVEALIHQDASLLLTAIETIDTFSPHYEEVLQQLITVWHAVALFQVTKQPIATEIAFETLLRYADTFAPEKVQLFYQMCLQGQTELMLAPHPKMGFEMICLRLLMFMPNEDRSNEALAVLPAATVKSVPLQPVAKSEPVVKPVALEKNTEIVTAVVNNQTPELSDWLTLMPQLPFTGLTKVLAEGAALLSKESGVWSFAISPQLGPLLNKTQVDKFSEVLSAFLQQKIVARFEIRQETLKTPAMVEAAAREAKQNAMVSSLATDAALQELIHSFDATVERVAEAKDPL